MDRLKTNIVPPDGPLDSLIYFFGEAPGEEEDRAIPPQPFIGSAGQFHNRCLRQVQLSRQETLHWNIFQQRPPNNKINYYFQDKNNTKLTWEGEEHVEQLRLWLEKRLADRDNGLGGPNVLVALGAVSTYILTGKRRITKWRGSVLPCTLVPGFKVYCMNHPSWVNRLITEPEERLLGQKKTWSQNALPLYMIDLARVIEQSEFPEIRRTKRNFDIDLPYSMLMFKLKELASLEAGMIGVDIETLPGEGGPILWCIGFSPSPEYAFVVPIIKEQRLVWSVAEEAHLMTWISKVFLNPNTKKIFQGGTYDLSILGRYYGLRLAPNTYEDTMLCHHATYPYLKKALETLCSIYTWEPYYKDEGKVNYGKRSYDAGEFRYNAKDCAVTREILPVTWRNAKELGFYEGYQRTLSVFPSHLGMMLRGIKIYLKKKDQLGQEFHNKTKFYIDSLREITGQEYNMSSSSQMQRLLYGYYNFPVQYNHKTKKVACDKDAISKLKKNTKHGTEEFKVLEIISNFRKFSKLASTYTGMEVDSDGRIHTTYGWVSTWRTSSSESPFGSGGNLQNIPGRTEEGKMVRRLFIPDDGMELLAADYSQAEARVVAYEADDLGTIELYNKGLDVHWEKTKDIFQITQGLSYNSKALYKDVFTGEDHTLYELRRLGKTIKHAGNYGEGPVRLQYTLAADGFYLDFKTCRNLIAQTKRADPFTQEWQRKIREKIRATRELTSSLGRKRRFLARLNDNLWRAAYAFSPQNTVGELLQIALQRVWSRLDYLQVLLNIHDEIMVQVKPNDRTKAMADMKELMEIPIEIHGRTLTIPVDFKVGPNWGDMEELG